MRHHRWWLVVLCVACTAVLAGFLFAGQYTSSEQKTIADLYALLVTPEGENRLELIQGRLDDLEEMVEDVDHEIDLVYAAEVARQEDAARQDEAQTWSLNDIKFQLDDLARTVADIQESVENCCP